jgi:hypothetical protein
MAKKLRHTASRKNQTKLYPRVEALIKILENKNILKGEEVDELEKELKQEMIENKENEKG